VQVEPSLGRTPFDAAWGPGWSPLGTWAVLGLAGTHRLDVVCGVIGSGKIQGWVDGRLAITLDKPKSLNPVVVSGPGFVDGNELIIYAESADGGVNVRCDVFANGRSLSTGEPLGVIPTRAATVDRRQPGYKNVLSTAANGVWIVPIINFWQTVLHLGTGPNLVIAVLALGVISFGVTGAVSYLLNRAFRRETLSKRRSGVVAFAGYAVALAGCMAGLLVAFTLARP
jgi:hypothetical protein